MKFIIPILLLISTFLTPIMPLLICMFSAVLFDTILAIYTTIKLNGINSFRSHYLFNLFIKLFFYLAAIMLAHGISISIFGGIIFGIDGLLPKFITALALFNEIKSIDETSMKLGNRSFWVVLKDFFKKAKEIKKDINELTSSDKKE